MIEFVPATTADLPKIMRPSLRTRQQQICNLKLLTKKLIGLQRTMIIFRHG